MSGTHLYIKKKHFLRGANLLYKDCMSVFIFKITHTPVALFQKSNLQNLTVEKERSNQSLINKLFVCVNKYKQALVSLCAWWTQRANKHVMEEVREEEGYRDAPASKNNSYIIDVVLRPLDLVVGERVVTHTPHQALPE